MILTLSAAPSEAHCYSRWYYPTPQRCSTGLYARHKWPLAAVQAKLVPEPPKTADDPLGAPVAQEKAIEPKSVPEPPLQPDFDLVARPPLNSWEEEQRLEAITALKKLIAEKSKQPK